MKVIVFGATGMVGQGVLRECLRDPTVEAVLVVGRTATGRHDGKLAEIVHADFLDFSTVEDRFAGYDACFFCLGVSSAGMSEDAYRRVTYDFTLAAARSLARVRPGMTFIYVSGTGTDSSERGRVMWARVKGRTENALLELPLQAYMFRPGYIQPAPGTKSKTRLYRVLYAVTTPLYPLLKRLAPNQVTSAEQVGRAMIRIAQRGAGKRILYNREINAIAADQPS
jgi:uncharacterized protein YbjT (DUF2867 family)